jgi:exodeoxyribonuclease V alpha subunit
MGLLVNAPRYPSPGIVERDFSLNGGGTVPVQGPALYLGTIGAALEYVPNGAGPWAVVDYFLPDDPAAWEVLCGDPQAFSGKDAAAVIAALGQAAPPPAFEALIEGLRLGNGAAAAASGACGDPAKWELLAGRILWFDRLRTLNFLRYFRCSATDAAELTRYCGPGLVPLLKRDPYRLAGQAHADFRVLDSIARYTGYRNRTRRLHAFVQCEAAAWIWSRGNTFGVVNRLVGRVVKTFGLARQQAEAEAGAALLPLQQNCELLVSQGVKTPNVLFYTYRHLLSAQRYAAQRAQALWAASCAGRQVSARARSAAAARYGLDRSQRAALDTALDHGISAVTGGPGTGKTYLITALVDLCSRSGLSVLVAAATGRAARNLTVRGVPAQTLHKLLSLRPVRGGGYECPYHPPDKPLKCDVLIVDEAGMLDAYAFHYALFAVRDGANVVLVGDPDQLPPVGPGLPFADTVWAMQPPQGNGAGVGALATNHRQGAGSRIPALAQKVNAGTLTAQDLTSNPDVAVRTVPAGISASRLGRVLVQAAAQYGGAWQAGAPFQPVLVLYPYKDEVERLNRLIQDAVNPGRLPLRPGDPVVQLVNEYEAEHARQSGLKVAVMNGEIGRVVAARPNAFGNLEEVEVEFDPGRVVVYRGPAVDAQLALAYVLTVHKAQGTEADTVIIPVLSGMAARARGAAWKRPLLYTAVTRARQKVVLVTDDPQAAARAARWRTPRRLTHYRGMVSGAFV